MIENIHSKQFVIIYQSKIQCSGQVQMMYVKAESFQNITNYITERKMLSRFFTAKY